MTQRRTTPRGRQRQSTKPNRKGGLIAVAGVFAVAIIALIIATLSSGGGADGVSQTADVSVSGPSLPLLTDSGGDAAIGMQMPEVTGTDFAGNTVTITNDGRPKVLLLLTHW